MPMKNLQHALEHEMQDLLHAERQILKALPKMAARASRSELREAFEEHAKETRGHVDRLEHALRSIGAEVKAEKCEGIQGILKEGEELIEEAEESGVLDAILIASAQKVEHYEIASYGTACAWAELLDHSEAAELLEENLTEEKAADEKLTQLAEDEINRRAREA